MVRRRLQEVSLRVFGLSWHAHISLLHFGQPALYLINDLYSLHSLDGLSALEQKHTTGHFEQLTVNIWFHLPSKNKFSFSTFGWTMQISPHSHNWLHEISSAVRLMHLCMFMGHAFFFFFLSHSYIYSWWPFSSQNYFLASYWYVVLLWCLQHIF